MQISEFFPVILAVLGFIALLAQRVYVRDEEGNATEIELPFLGKMKTNIPALLFVFLGAGVFIYSNEADIRSTSSWKFDGELVFDPEVAHLKDRINLNQGRVVVFPRFENGLVMPDGSFTLSVYRPGNPIEYINNLCYTLKVSDTCTLIAMANGHDLKPNDGLSKSYNVAPLPTVLRAREGSICD